ncbi:LolA family protein [Sandaracinobacteroides saxicola]|uniref:Outer-membrane lipoprotein carrier protein LolA n=1 Tax=Sandaracinobacteroides saxicola TaxID=2759707 RepID=A0A7G5IE69_9SPHN|nr:outer membrane lipoprotein carrier protein LolA [Sandaracinobacteroides saxicola]QMW21661.1 outer-membrane lipoprotein carrier protein LolA [Sandaracinobacteroides saxicola]
MRQFFLMAALVAAPAAAQGVSLAEVQAALVATTSMTADFVQTAGNGSQARGVMSLQRPGRIRFDYGPGARILVVADGRNLSFIDYKVGQVSQWPVKATPLGVLLDPRADLSRVARVLPDSEVPVPGMVGVVASDPKRPDLGRITFFLSRSAGAPGGLALAGWRVVDAQGQQTQVQLSNIVWNPAIPAGRFAFVDPRRRLMPPGKGG